MLADLLGGTVSNGRYQAERLVLIRFFGGGGIAAASSGTCPGAAAGGASANAATLAGACGVEAVLASMAPGPFGSTAAGATPFSGAVSTLACTVAVAVAGGCVGAGTSACAAGAFAGAVTSATGAASANGIAEGVAACALITKARPATDVSAGLVAGSTSDNTTAALAIAPIAVETATMRAVCKKLGAGAR